MPATFCWSRHRESTQGVDTGSRRKVTSVGPPVKAPPPRRGRNLGTGTACGKGGRSRRRQEGAGLHSSFKRTASRSESRAGPAACRVGGGDPARTPRCRPPRPGCPSEGRPKSDRGTRGRRLYRYGAAASSSLCRRPRVRSVSSGARCAGAAFLPTVTW